MATRKSRSKSPQAQLGRTTQNLGSQALADARRRLAQLDAERQARQKLSARELRAFERRKRRAKDAEELAKLEQLQRLGLYSPRLDPLEAPRGFTAAALTPARRKAINRHYRRAESLTSGAVFAPYPAKADKAARAIIRAEVERSGGIVTRKGIFLPRAERELRQPKGRLVYDKTLKLWTVEVKKVSRKRGKRTTTTEIRPLAGQDALERLQAQFIKKFDRAPFDPKNERLRFMIQGRNISRRSFRSLSQLFAYALGYRSDARSQATFLHGLTIVRVVRDDDGDWLDPVSILGGRGWKGTTAAVEDRFEAKREREQ